MLPMMMIGSALLVGAGLQHGRTAAGRHAQAREMNREARLVYAQSRENLFRWRRKAINALADLGLARLGVMERSIPWLVATLQPCLEDAARLTEGDLDQGALAEMAHQGELARTLLSQGIDQIPRSLLVGLGAYGTGVLREAAHAEAAMTMLEEMTCGNTTVKWMGVGQAACPEGKKGELTCNVLGRMELGPALALGVLMMAAQSMKDVEVAQKNLMRATQAAGRIRSAVHILTGMWRVAGDFLRVTVHLDRHTNQVIRQLQPQPAPPRALCPNEEALADLCRFLLVLNALLTAPLITDAGALTKSFPKALDAGFDFIDAMGWEQPPEGQ